jgi:outer membrane receptor protein involved in Fe transport
MVFWLLNLMKNNFMKQIFLLLLLVPCALFSQSLKGSVVDLSSNEAVAFPQIQFGEQGMLLGDENGQFEITNTAFPLQIIITAPDYVKDTFTIKNAGSQTFQLKSLFDTDHSNDIGTIVIAASRRRQAIEDVPVSLEVIKPELITNKGITDLEQAVDQAPGAYAMDGQISIRGGSGFSYGAGSRVLVLWNEVPLLSADAGDAKWNAIPIESAQQIEVIKGASSVLYGSGALNGIVSLIEREPGPETAFSAKIQSGVFDNPRRSTLRWWDKNPTQHQADVTFSKQFGRFGVNLGAYGFTSDGYRQGETEDRGRMNGTFYWRPEHIQKLKVSIGWNLQLQKTGNFIIWQSDTFAYQPVGGADTSLTSSSLTYNRGTRFSIDPSVKYFDKYGNKHQLKSRYYLVDNLNYSNPSQSSQSQVLFGDYQFQRGWNNNAFVLTAGTSTTYNTINSYLFGDHHSFNAAAYGQLEKKWKKVDITAGVRMEYYQQDGIRGDSDFYFGKDSSKLPIRPIFRTGVHYEIAKYTHLRASFGQGVRYPTVAERYTQTAVGSLLIFPNAAVKPETGWAAELGIKQGVKIANWKGFIDVAAFVNTYQNMMEFTFGAYNPDSIPLNFFNPNDPGYYTKWLGFRAQNAESAQITGIELSVNGEGAIGPIKVQTLAGYTYMNPISKNTNAAYRATFSDTSSNMLKYRFKHMAKADLQLSYKGFSLGGSMRLNSYMTNIDAIFEDGLLGQQILVGLKQYRETHHGLTVVFDARVGYTWKEKYKAAFIVNNVFNVEYASRPGDIQPPRTFMIQLSYHL